uniref:Olfactomedin-like domain-containing protein n=1 Tax=Timema tahoe TaxID=61484 RepID=A0A7R9IHP5_9NEOP|nr:unnamed protein product [Timema tahoe]
MTPPVELKSATAPLRSGPHFSRVWQVSKVWLVRPPVRVVRQLGQDPLELAVFNNKISHNRPYWGLVERNVFLSFLVATPLFEVTWLQDDPLFAEIDPQLATPPPVHVGGGQGVAVYGERPPTPVDLNDLCPPPEACPECHVPKEAKCNDGGIALFHLVGRMEIKPFANATYPGLPSRVLVGKPVYHRNTEALYGSWMRDPMPVMETLGEKLWVTKENDTYHLFEYSNKTMFRRDIATKRYKLDYPFKCCAIKAPSWPACETICGPSFEQRIAYLSRRWGTEDCRCANSIKEAVMSCLLYICKSIKSFHKSGQV